MDFHFSVLINRSAEDVFEFISDFRNHHQEAKSQVMQVEKLTPGPAGLGTRYREVVRVVPLITVEMISEISRFEPNDIIEMTWSGG